ncbi:MAG: hypothetical protein V7L05_00530 [Nostoc sp.]|uniref:hypothetical protein n=1 Tax=Nostoc sp. TaxID=1180 RepID=UPI002FFD2702
MGSHCGGGERLHKASGVETPCSRAASPKSKIELPNALCPIKLIIMNKTDCLCEEKQSVEDRYY